MSKPVNSCDTKKPTMHWNLIITLHILNFPYRMIFTIDCVNGSEFNSFDKFRHFQIDGTSTIT